MPAILEVRHFSKHYGNFSVQNLSFNLNKGEIAGLIGRNGTGKSTIIRGIMGLTKIDSGEVLIDGTRTRPFGQHLHWIGYVPDRPIFYEWMSVDDAIRFTSKFYRAFDLELAARLKEDFDLRGQKPIKALSHGMRTKLALLLALAHEPKLLILDEPTTGLDPVFRADILEYLSSLRRNGRPIPILFSSHILSDVERIADQIIVVRKGRLAGIYKAGELANAWSLLVADEALEISGRVAGKDWKTKNALGRVALCITNKEIDETMASLSASDRRRIRIEHPTTEDVLMELI